MQERPATRRIIPTGNPARSLSSLDHLPGHIFNAVKRNWKHDGSVIIAKGTPSGFRRQKKIEEEFATEFFENRAENSKAVLIQVDQHIAVFVYSTDAQGEYELRFRSVVLEEGESLNNLFWEVINF